MKVYEYAVATTNDDCLSDIYEHRKLVGEFYHMREIVMHYRDKFNNRDLQLSTNFIDETNDYDVLDGDVCLPDNVTIYFLDDGKQFAPDYAPDGLLVIVGA